MRFFVAEPGRDLRLVNFAHQREIALIETKYFDEHDFKDILRRVAPKADSRKLFEDVVFEDEESYRDRFVFRIGDDVLRALSEASASILRGHAARWHHERIKDHMRDYHGLKSRKSRRSDAERNRETDDAEKVVPFMKFIQAVQEKDSADLRASIPHWWALNRGALSGARDMRRFRWDETEIDAVLPSAKVFSRKNFAALTKTVPALAAYIRKQDRVREDAARKTFAAEAKCGPACPTRTLAAPALAAYVDLFLGLRRLALSAARRRKAMFMIDG
jgi:hypothetical protein